MKKRLFFHTLSDLNGKGDIILIALSDRLQAVASLIPTCKCAADVGTDHGYLAVWLLQNRKAAHVFATDIHAGPLSRAKQTASEQDCADRMTFHLCDGLQFPDAEQADAVILAGMGGETMISILQEAPWSWSGTALILQPQSKQELLFQWLREHGIGLVDAKLCADAGKLYLALLARGGADTSVTAEDLLMSAQDALLPRYLEEEINRIERAEAGALQSRRELKFQHDAWRERKQYLAAYQEVVKNDNRS